LVVVGAALLFVGFTCDDLLRGRVPIEVAQVIEEMAELVGALVFLAAVLAPESAEAGFVRGARARS
jgi:hypothetical protein